MFVVPGDQAHFAALRRLSRPIERRAQLSNTSILKRACDITVALLLLAALAPGIALIALALAIEGGGPVIYRQERTGLGRRVFSIYKFRTMRCDPGAETFVQATPNDPRVTPIGRFLRRSSLDELPQLINVLRGEMSMVGPRPHAVEMDFALARLLDDYWDRHLVKPGLTGLAQVSGSRGPTPTIEHARRRLRFDRLYVRQWSLLLDVRILLATPFHLFGSNAH